MKNSIKTFAVALAIVASAFTANAEDKETKKSAGFGTGIYTTKNGKINVLVDKASNEASTVLLLKTEKGDVVYREIVDKNNQKFGRALNVDGLATGNYLIEVTSNGEKQTKSFQLSEQTSERVVAIK
jgi:hypothetical protein